MNLKKRFQFRAFVSILTGFSFLVVSFSGVVLFFSPQGRIANWSNWTFWGVDKHRWGDLHTCFSVLFILAAAVHIWLNRKPLVTYFAAKLQTARKFRSEWLVAAALCGLFVWGSLRPFVPFSNLLDLGTRFKYRTVSLEEKPPIPHAELLTIAELAKQAGMETETVLLRLQSHQIEAESSDIFGEVAEKAGLSPSALYTIAQGKAGSSRSETGGRQQRGGQGGGFGQQTLARLCEQMNLSPEEAIARLNAAGIEAAADDTVRRIAENNGVRPSEIRQLLESPTWEE
jgi:hypothetical protein